MMRGGGEGHVASLVHLPQQKVPFLDIHPGNLMKISPCISLHQRNPPLVLSYLPSVFSQL